MKGSKVIYGVILGSLAVLLIAAGFLVGRITLPQEAAGENTNKYYDDLYDVIEGHRVKMAKHNNNFDSATNATQKSTAVYGMKEDTMDALYVLSEIVPPDSKADKHNELIRLAIKAIKIADDAYQDGNGGEISLDRKTRIIEAANEMKEYYEDM